MGSHPNSLNVEHGPSFSAATLIVTCYYMKINKIQADGSHHIPYEAKGTLVHFCRKAEAILGLSKGGVSPQTFGVPFVLIGKHIYQ